MGRIGIPELILILVIVIVIFGPSKLPGIGKALGDSISQFKSGIGKKNEDEKVEDDKEDKTE